MRCSFKLSRRLAQSHYALFVALLASACSMESSLLDDVLTPPDSTNTLIRAVASVAVTPQTASLAVGDIVQLTAIARDSSGSVLDDRAVLWETSATSVANVSDAGVVTAGSAGSAVVRATVEGRMDSATVTVSPPPPTTRVGFYVAPNGSSGGDGSMDDPWNLPTALAGAGGRIGAGDTVWLRGGTYRGFFRSTIGGSPDQPVVVRQYPGERAIIDAAASGGGIALNVRGQWSVFWGFEITNSNTVRSADQSGSDGRPHAIANYASHTRYVNLVVHDGGVAFYSDPEYVDLEITGCIFYNNGWQGPVRGGGHALYLKSYTGPVVVRDNIMFNQFGYGVHVYTNEGSGELNNILLERNVSFNNGTLSTNSQSQNILVGGADYATDDVVKDNIVYFSPGITGSNMRIGYQTLRNGSVEVRGNYAVGGSPVLDFGYWSQATVRSNTFVGSGSLVNLHDAATGGHIWSQDIHRRDPSSDAWQYNGSSYTFSGWRSATGLGSTDQALAGAPSTPHVVVVPNRYEVGRATVVVVNWGRVGSIPVDLSGVLPLGAGYEIRNVQALFSAPVLSGTFTGGAVLLPMSGVTPPVPIGLSSSRAPKTGPDFDVFVVTKRNP